MKIEVACPWCHTVNKVADGNDGILYCCDCGHRIGIPRSKCDCSKCKTQVIEVRCVQKERS